jgi:hypothetical protein
LRDGVEDPLHAGSDTLGGSPGRGWSPFGGAHEVEEVRPLDLVELEGSRDRFEHIFGDASDVAAFELRVVLDADVGEERHLLASQPRDSSPPTVGA